MITQRAEITKGSWCTFVWNPDNEEIRVEWDNGYPPPHPTPAMRKRLDDALNEFTTAVWLKTIEMKLEEHDEDHEED